jgi:hypothetical protein
MDGKGVLMTGLADTISKIIPQNLLTGSYRKQFCNSLQQIKVEHNHNHSL